MAPGNDAKLKRLRDLLPGAVYLPADSDPAVTMVRTDATAVLPGDIYVHLDAFDSTDAEIAAGRGAAAVIAERLLPDISAPLVLVEDCFAACAELTAATAPLRSTLPTIINVGGVTGAGRVATIVAAIHAHAGERVGLFTDACDDDGEHCLPRQKKTKDAASRWLQRCELGDVTTAIAQTVAGEEAEATALVACLVSLRCDGLDDAGRPCWESIAAHRRAIVESLGELDAGVTLVVNADDAECIRVASSHTGRVLTFGESKTADIRVVPAEAHAAGQTLIVAVGSDSACVAIGSPGRAARRDAIAAIATAIAAGFDLQTAVRGVDLTPCVAGSLSPVPCGQAFSVYIDAAVRPSDLADAFDGVQGSGRVLAVVKLADSAIIALRQLASAAKLADRVFAYGRVELEDDTPAGVTVVEDRLSAIAVAIGLADEGDSVLVAGSRDEASDRELIKKLLRRRLECEDRRAAA
jgi:UDP-N-acetylmuramoyl-L-alanyl-D-glutamate--2,6-diaminopimelate ligase